jgi:hydrogenase-4 component F
MSAMRDGLRLLPWSGPLFLLAVFALSAFPPSGVFRSEFEIVAGGLGSGSYAGAAVLVILVTVAFLGLITSVTGVLLRPAPPGAAPAEPGPAETGPAEPVPAETGPAEPGPAETGPTQTVPAETGAGADSGAVVTATRAPARRALTPGEPSALMVVPVLAGLVVLVLLGVHPPAELTNLIARAAAQLGGAP